MLIGPIKFAWDVYKLRKALLPAFGPGKSRGKVLRDLSLLGGIWWLKEEAEETAKGNFIEGTNLADPDDVNRLPRVVIIRAATAVTKGATQAIVMPPMWRADP